MSNLSSRIALPAILAVACHFVSLPALALDYGKPSKVRQLIQQIMRRPQPRPGSTAYYYSSGIAHYDSFVPYAPDMTEEFDRSKPHHRYTYHDGRIAKCEFFEGRGKPSSYHAVWHSSAGAPILSAYFGKDGLPGWYMYAEYGSSGKIAMLYRFGSAFEFLFRQEFTYQGGTTRIRRFNRGDPKPATETLYEHGEIFLITNGVKKKVNNADREQEIRTPVKFGLKPIYPGF